MYAGPVIKGIMFSNNSLRLSETENFIGRDDFQLAEKRISKLEIEREVCQNFGAFVQFQKSLAKIL